MKDNNLPQSLSGEFFEPIYFPRKDELCRRLDEFYMTSGVQKDTSPSSMFLGALYTMQKEHREKNPDWMAQVAHSLREIFYELGLDWKIAIKNYGSTYDETIGVQKVGAYKNLITNIAHHNLEEASKNSIVGGSKDNPIDITPVIFEQIVLQFGDIIFAVLRRQVDAHREVDGVLKINLHEIELSHVKEIHDLNPDARQYFYVNADERWLEWLWKNGFFNAIKRKAEDLTKYRFSMPELHYLVRMAEKNPKKVAEIILDTPISDKTFNPEVVDQFLRICTTLPVKQLPSIVRKIHDEKWIQLMEPFHQYGFEYEELFKKLEESQDYKSILMLAETVLTVRRKEEIEKSKYGTDGPFYFNNLSYTKVFEYLLRVNDEYTEDALKLVSQKMKAIVLLSGEAKDSKVFTTEDMFHLYDVDFFTLTVDQNDSSSDREDIQNLAAVMKTLTQHLLEKQCDKPNVVRSVYKKYISSLPDSRTMWRLKLFALSLCPKVFRNELKKSFFRLFEVKDYHEIVFGAEYERALQKGFAALSNNEKHNYIKQVIDYFNNQSGSEYDQRWHKTYGSRILSVIADHLTPKEKDSAHQAGYSLEPNYEPKPSIGRTITGTVVPKGPISQEEFGDLTITDIAKKLQTEWSPENLKKQNKVDDTFTPLNAEGLGKQLRDDMLKRLQDYVNDADRFFEREMLDLHYTYSFLRGIQEAIKNNREDASKVNWDGFIRLCFSIKKSVEDKPIEQRKREHNSFDSWLTNWNSIHSAMADDIQELLNADVKIGFQNYRKQLFELFNYLLVYPDPIPSDERIETATMTTKPAGKNDHLITDPFTIAINSVRGRAFEAFLLFVYWDGQKFSKEDISKISSDVKKLYEKVLSKENTRAIMFMFGHYLPSFYFRDKEWIRALLPKIFPVDSDKKYIYTAAWEGYLTNNLYEEMFLDPNIQNLYKRGLLLTNLYESKQEYFKDPNKGIAIHLALAFIHYKKFDFQHPLFITFWKKSDPDRHAEFVSFIGRFIFGDNSKFNEFIEKEAWVKKRLKDFWNWMLEEYKNLKPFHKFGYWINLEKNLFEPAWLAKNTHKTLDKTEGSLDWDYGLMKSVPQFAKEAPKETLEIARLYLFGKGKDDEIYRIPHLDEEWFEALDILYKNSTTKKDTYKLIDDLIREKGSVFWGLKKIIN